LSRMSDLHFPTVCVSDLLLKSISLRHFLWAWVFVVSWC
jgi:hypothetical protein